MWKALIKELIEEVQHPFAANLDTNRSMAHTHVPGHNEAIMMGCQGVSLGFAVVFTTLVLVLLRVLPTTKAEAGAPCSSARAVWLHFCEIVGGSCALPIAWAWHHWFADIARALIQPLLLNPGSSLNTWSTEGQWALGIGIISAEAVISLVILGALRAGLAPAFSARKATWAADTPLGARVVRYEAVSHKVYDFLMAWMVYALLHSLYASDATSECFPMETPYLMHGLTEGATLLVMLAIALVYMASATIRAATGNRLPTRLCGTSMGAACWVVLLGTIGIQLGWSVHVAYEQVVDIFIEAADLDMTHEIVTDVAIAGAAVTTFAGLFMYSRLYGEMKKSSTGQQSDSVKV